MSLVKFILEAIISSLFYYSGLYWLYTKLTNNWRNIPIIYYHEVGSNEKKKKGLAEFSVKVDNFEKQMRWLSRHYHVVSVNELVKYLNGEIRLSGRVVAVTFDGGYIGNYQHAFQILKKHNVPATIYVTTNCIDGNVPWKRKLLYLISLTKKERYKLTYSGKEHEFEIKNRYQKSLAKRCIQEYMAVLGNEEQDNLLKQVSQELNVELSGLANKIFLSWDQIRELNRNPLITIGSHSLTHAILTDVSPEVANREILESKIHIEDKLGEKITSFCYPDGCFSKEAIDLVKKAGYSSGLAVNTPEVLSVLNKIGDDVFKLRRICMPDRSYIPLLAIELSGLMRIIKKAAKIAFAKR